MQIIINIKKKHLYGFLTAFIVILGAFMVTAFGGSNPAVLGHSAGELIVTGSSITDGTVTGSDVDESTLTCTSIPGLGGSLCDGSDQDTDQQQLGTSGSSITLTNSGSVIAPDLSCVDCISGTEISEAGLGVVPEASTFGFCNWGNADYCFDVSGRSICSPNTCSGGACAGCGPKISDDMVFTCNGARITQMNAVSSATC